MTVRTAVFLFCAGALLSGCATSRPLVERYPELLGEYRGRVSTEQESYPVTTILKFNARGVLQGTYSFEDATNKVSGILHDFRNSRDRSVECTWNDEYGIGILKLTFSDDLQRFKGRWGDDGKVARKCVWDGVRAPTSPR